MIDFMIKLHFKILILFIAISVINITASAGNEIKIVAEVAGVPITSVDLDNRIKLLSVLGVLKGKQINIKDEVLSQIIDEIIYEKAADLAKIKLSKNEIEESMKNVAANLGADNINKFCQDNKLDCKHLRKKLKREIIWQKLAMNELRHNINITENDLMMVARSQNKLEMDFIFAEVTKEQINYLNNNKKYLTKCELMEKFLHRKFNISVNKYNNMLAKDLIYSIAQNIAEMNINEFKISPNHAGSYDLLMLCHKRAKFDNPEEKRKVEESIIQLRLVTAARLHLDKLKKQMLIKVY